MSDGLKRLPDSELEIMKALWAADEPLTRPQLEVALQHKQWASTTVLGLVARLEGKGFVERHKQGRGYLIRAAVSEAEYLPVESRSALERMFEGSAKNLIAALHQCDALTRQDVEELADYLAKLEQEVK